ncbi:MAG: AAA family ATPase [Alistipes sp.]|nr:AAA family ATPase [Alistipes sp.]
MNATLNIGQTIGDYRVEELVKASDENGGETYFVSGRDGKKALMKLYAVEAEAHAIECGSTALSQNLGFVPMVASGSIEHNGCSYRYIVRDYVEAKRLSDLIDEGKLYSWEQATPIVLQVLVALKHLHSQEPAIIHNDITARNILIKEEDENVRVYIIGMGHLSHRCNGKATFCTKDLNNWYRAPETFKGIYDEQSDIFSVGALLHTMLEGFEPWGIASDALGPDVDKNHLKHIRSVGDEIIDDMHLTKEQKAILAKMIALDYDNRYRTVNDVIKDLTKGNVTESIRETLSHSERRGDSRVEPTIEKHINAEEIKPRIGGGFADVAGMESVKSMLYKDVMFVMQNKEKAAKYRLKAPNGALFYGPPGCGKTFIAEKFAEESHLNFMMVKASDLGSIYIHGTQGKIAELFEEAAKKAPTVICFDELDGMVPDRSTIHNEGASGEVNEFLSQLNNCSERGIFVIGTSNCPEKIDPAILRTGRMDKMVYIPMPDVEARKELFKIHLADRYCDESIDLEELAKQSDGYVASDISYMVNASALEAAMADVPISQELVLAEMRKARRSVTQDDAADYERMRKKFEQQTPRQERRRIGF